MLAKSMAWFRFYAEAVDDEKLRLLAKEDRWDYVALLCLKRSGVLDVPQEATMLHRKVAIKLGVTTMELEQIARRLAEVGLITVPDLQPIGWDKRQYESDSSTQRTREYRERMKRHSDGLDTEADTEDEANASSLSYSAEFEQAWAAYPKRPGANKRASYRAWNGRLKQGYKPDDILAGVHRYARYVVARRTEPGYIKQPATFFGPDLHFLADWPLPVIAQHGRQGGSSEASEFLDQALGRNRPADHGCVDVEARIVG